MLKKIIDFFRTLLTDWVLRGCYNDGRFEQLPIDFIRRYKNYLNLDTIVTSTRNLDRQFLHDCLEDGRVDFIDACRHQLFEKTIEEFAKSRFDWFMVSSEQKSLSEDFMKRNADKLDWNHLLWFADKENLSDEFIVEMTLKGYIRD